MKIATKVVSTDIFKTAGIKSTKACYFILILQLSVVSAFCFFTICKIEKNELRTFLAYIFRMSNTNFQVDQAKTKTLVSIEVVVSGYRTRRAQLD